MSGEWNEGVRNEACHARWNKIGLIDSGGKYLSGSIPIFGEI